ncbi:helix-turn-helix domain-containing protein [Candidatus Woesearchaeota archaeon]|nr:helix-turn-helix domain-containing protein [Candidatus Woesearchaeota archaeon]
MDGVEGLEKLIEKKLLLLIKTILSEPNKEFYLQELSEKSKVPIATTFRLLNKLIELKLIEERKISRFTIYKLSKNKEIEFLSKLFKFEIDPIKEFSDLVNAKFAISSIYRQGEKSDKKSNLVILGYDIEANQISEIAKEIKVNYNYLINFIILTPEQFKQMENMGINTNKHHLIYNS